MFHINDWGSHKAAPLDPLFSSAIVIIGGEASMQLIVLALSLSIALVARTFL